MAENEAPKKPEDAQAPPLTREELAAKLEELSARARAAGLSPIEMMGRSYLTRGMKVLDGFLSAMEDGAPKKPEDAPVEKKA